MKNGNLLVLNNLMNLKGYYWISLLLNLLLCTSVAAQDQQNQIRLAEKLIKNGQWLKAFSISDSLVRDQKVISNNSERIKIYELAAKTRGLLLQRREALSYWDQALEINEERNSTYFSDLTERGLALSAIGNFEGAFQSLQEVQSHYLSEGMGGTKDMAATIYALAMASARSRDLKAARGFIEESYNIYLKIEDRNSIPFANVEALYGYLLWQSDQFDLAVEHFVAAEHVFREQGGNNSDWLGALSVNLGSCYDEMGFPRKAIPLYERAEIIFKRLDPTHPILRSVYNNLGNSYSDIGEYSSAIQYLKLALALSSLPRYHNNLGDAYLKYGQYEAAEEQFTLALNGFLLADQIDSANIARPYHNLAIIYRQKEEYEKALAFEKRSLPFRMAGTGLYQLDVARTFQGIGESYTGLEKYDSAVFYLDSALLVQKNQIRNRWHYEIVLSHLSMAELYQKQNRLVQALIQLDSALSYTGYERTIEEVATPLEFLMVLNLKARLLQKQSEVEQNINLALSARNTFSLALEGLSYWHQRLSEEYSKTQLIENYHNIFENAISNSSSLYDQTQDGKYLEDVFRYIQQNKSLVLREAINRKQAFQVAGVPTSLLEKEKILSREIALLEKQLRDLESIETGPGSTERKLLYNVILEKKKTYKELEKTFEKEHPAFYQLKYSVKAATIKKIQRELKRRKVKTGLVEFFLGQDFLFSIYITSNEVKHVFHPLKEPLDESIQSIRRIISNEKALALSAEQQLHEFQSFYKLSNGLYRNLLKPVLSESKVKQLIIVPDGTLNYLPFQLLLEEEVNVDAMSKADYTKLPYLFLKHSISYAYSASLLLEKNFSVEEPHYDYIGFAPSYKKDSIQKSDGAYLLDPLKYNVQEISASAELFSNAIEFLGDSATERQFRGMASSAKILHCSMHGIVSSDEPLQSLLAFSPANSDSLYDDLLHVYELYNMQIQADLAILSACNTGVGYLQKGEGVVSLARAFRYAGCSNVLMSLWSANDESSAKIISEFFTKYKEGVPKTEALNKAVGHYLFEDRTISEIKKHPFFWSNFVLIGNDWPVSNTSTLQTSLWLGIFALLLIVWAVRRYYIYNKA